MIEYRTINRLAAVIRPTEAFLGWVNSILKDENDPLSMEMFEDEYLTLLVPDFEDNLKAYEYVLKRSRDILEWELYSWFTDRDLWPKRLDRRLFKKWFRVEIHSEVIDLVRGEIHHDHPL